MPKLARYRAGYLLSKFVVFSFLFWTLYTTNRFHIAVDLSSNRSQRTSKYGKNKEVAHSPAARVPLFLFLSHFDVICYLLLNRRTATWNVKPGRIKAIRAGETVNGFATGQLEWVLGGCLHDTGATFGPARVHSGSLSGLYICFHDTTTKQNVMPARVTPAWVHPAQVFCSEM